MRNFCLVVIIFLMFPFVDATCGDVSKMDSDVVGANIHLREGRFDRAIGLFMKKTKKYPNDPLLTVALATCYYMKKDYRKAVDYLDKTVEMDKKKVLGNLRDYEGKVNTEHLKWQIYYNGSVEYSKDDLAKGIELAKKALEVDDSAKMSQSYNLLATLVFNSGDFEEGVKFLMKAIEIDVKNVEARMGLGHRYLAKGDTENALKYLNQALKIDSTQIKAYELIGQAHLVEKAFDKAIQSLEKALSITGKNPTILYNIMVANYSAKSYDEAINKGKEILALEKVENSIATKVYNLMGQAYQEKEDYKNVIAVVKEAIDKGLNDCNSYSLISHAYYKLGDNKTSGMWAKKLEECVENK